jgi:hypothetical protein
MMHAPQIDTPQERMMAVDTALKIFSGWSDYWKARFIWTNSRLVSTSGYIGPETETPTADGWAALAGFGTAAGRRSWEESLDFSDEKRNIKSLAKWYMNTTRDILRTWEANGYRGDDGLEKRRMGVSMMWTMFEDRPDLRRMFMDELGKQLAFDYEKGGDNMIRILIDQITLGGEIAEETAQKLQGLVNDGLLEQSVADSLTAMYKDFFANPGDYREEQ